MKRRMKRSVAIPIVFSAMTFAWCAGAQRALAQVDDSRGREPSTFGETGEQNLELTVAQRRAIYDVVSKDTSKKAPVRFPAVVGADVPPMIELYVLPDDVVATNPTAKIYKYTMVQDQVVLVDPTKMRVVDIIGPASRQPSEQRVPGNLLPRD